MRSDQYSLVKKGVPAVYLNPGAKESGSNEKMVSNSDFLKQHYHQPSDDLNLPIDYEWAAKFVDINLAIAESIANTEQTPAWNEDSFFKTFAK